MPKVEFTSRYLIKIQPDETILFDPGKIMLAECVAVEKATGLSWPQVLKGLDSGLMISSQAVVWIMRKRSNPRLRLAEVDFSYGDLSVKDPDYDPDFWVLADQDADEDDPTIIVIPDDPAEAEELQVHAADADEDEEEGKDRPQDTPLGTTPEA